jgi:hypothetical protein
MMAPINRSDALPSQGANMLSEYEARAIQADIRGGAAVSWDRFDRGSVRAMAAREAEPARVGCRRSEPVQALGVALRCVAGLLILASMAAAEILVDPSPAPATEALASASSALDSERIPF